MVVLELASVHLGRPRFSQIGWMEEFAYWFSNVATLTLLTVRILVPDGNCFVLFCIRAYLSVMKSQLRL